MGNMTETSRIQRLAPPEGPVRLVLDTDTYNEIDDQFAVVHALLSPKELSVEALYAAPFLNDRSSSPHDGMEKSYEEIHRLIKLLHISSCPVYRGSEAFLDNSSSPQTSEAAEDLISRAMEKNDRPLYVAAIGAITNVASAILLEPRILERIVVVWLGGNAVYWPNAKEFNLQQDIIASRLIFDCGVPLIQLPCQPVVSHLLTTEEEMKAKVGKHGPLGQYLSNIFCAYCEERGILSKVIWDIAATSWLIDPQWVKTTLVHSPILTDQFTWSFDSSRHLIRSAASIDRDAIFSDVFSKLQKQADTV